jgi:diguanylate cyclase (GGDEF)-like protein
MRRAEAQLKHLAYTDTVTDLPNRRCTYEALELEIAMHGETGGRVGLLLVDLDNFKVVNDTAGHAAGDRLLRQVASVLRAAARPSDRIGRIGGDEFAVIVAPLDDAAELERVGQRIIGDLRQPLQVEGLEVTPTASIGACVFPDDAHTMSELLSNADAALYRAKANGRDNVAVFEREMILATQRRARLDRDLRRHLEAGLLELCYQPQYACGSRKMVGVEALLRWPHPDQGYISPAEFIPIAEESGLIVEVGKWVLERACLDAVTLYRQTGTWLSMAVNVSARQLRDKDFIRVVEHTLTAAGMPPERLELELTESMLMEDLEGAIDFMHNVRALGVRLSIDDFGTGYSSLAYLQTFPINHLKIDRSFVRLLPTSGTTIAGAVIALAHGFNLTVVAEGVEEPEQFEWLRQAGCDYVQGYLLARPLPLAALRARVLEERVPAA